MPEPDPLRLLLSAAQSALLVVDVQERLVPALPDADRLLASVALLAQIARLLGVPTAVTEHCAGAIGGTVPALKAELAHAVFVQKHHFAATRAPAFAAVLQAWRSRTVVVAGAEAHVCVMQVALAMREAGMAVCVCADAVGARHPDDTAIALERMRMAGVVPVSVEMLATEWLEDAEDPRFREMLGWIKQRHRGRVSGR